MPNRMDLRSWKVFWTLESSFIENIRMAMVVDCARAGIIVMRNSDVFSIGSGKCLGLRGTQATKVPLKIKELAGLKITGIYSGGEFVVVLTEDGKLFVWGFNVDGRLGIVKGDFIVNVPTRLELPNDERVTEVACGYEHTIGLTSSGKVYFWGRVAKEKYETPTEIFKEDGLEKNRIISIACGAFSLFVLRNDGHIQMCHSGFGSIEEPKLVTVKAQITKMVSSLGNDLLLLDNKGRMYAWSRNGDPTRVAEKIGPVLDIAAIWQTSLKVCRTNAGVYFWGKWLGKEWECPSSRNFTSIHALFAMDKQSAWALYASVMCRPYVGNHRQTPVLPGFSDQFSKRAGADLELKLKDGRVVYAHQVVLASRSIFFRDLLTTEASRNSSSPTLAEVAVLNVDPDSFHSLLHYIYKGRVDKSIFQDRTNLWKRMLELLKTSHHCAQMDLFTECKNILMLELTADNACEVFQVANKLHIEDLENHALQLMAPPNFYKIIQSDAPAGVIRLIASRLSEMEIHGKQLEKDSRPLSSATAAGSTSSTTDVRTSSAAQALGFRFSAPIVNPASSELKFNFGSSVSTFGSVPALKLSLTTSAPTATTVSKSTFGASSTGSSIDLWQSVEDLHNLMDNLAVRMDSVSALCQNTAGETNTHPRNTLSPRPPNE